MDAEASPAAGAVVTEAADVVPLAAEEVLAEEAEVGPGAELREVRRLSSSHIAMQVFLLHTARRTCWSRKT